MFNIMKYLYLIIVIFGDIFCYSQYPPIATLPSTLVLNKIDNLYVPFQNNIPVPDFEKQGSKLRTLTDLKGSWKKQRFHVNHDYTMGDRMERNFSNIIKESGGKFKKSYDDSKWENKNIPAVENDMHVRPDGAPEIHYDKSEFNGGVWYRRHFNLIPGNSRNSFYKLMFYSVNYVCDVWINDKYIGYHEGGYTPFAFDITDFLDKSGDNVIAIRVDNPPIIDPTLSSPADSVIRYDLVPYNPWLDWFSYTGVIHDIFIEETNDLSVVRDDITPLDIDGNIRTRLVLYDRNNLFLKGKLYIKYEIYEANINSENCRTEFSSSLISPTSLPVSTSTKEMVFDAQTIVNEQELKIPNPKLWFPYNGKEKFSNLYILKVTLYDTTRSVKFDEYSTQFGNRILRKIGNKITLNNKYIFFTGVARHEDHPDFGRSIPVDFIYNDLLILRDYLKSNWLRSAHYPNHLYTYQITDRLGMAVMEEIPVWSFNDPKAWNVQDKRRIHYQMYREMIFKDFNRPSIICWSLANENSLIDRGIKFIKNVKSEINLDFSDGRLIGQAAAAYWSFCNIDSSQKYCDYSGWNLYVPNIDPGSCQKQLDKFLDDANVYLKYDQPMIGTEFNGERDYDNFIKRFDIISSRIPFTESGGLNCSGYISAITYWIAINYYSTCSKFGSAYGHTASYGLLGLDRKDNPNNSERQILIKRFTPYFNFGGVYNGDQYCK